MTINGNASDNFINGTAGNEIIDGLGGNDTIRSLSGNDIVFGGPGDDDVFSALGFDTIRGGDGNDTLRGGSDIDLLVGDDGNDSVGGDDGNDALEGGSGNDTMFGDNDIDSLVGEDGDDYLDGGSGNDVLEGESGNDELIGGAGNDVLEGGSGDDILSDAAGIDILLGQDGNDSLVAFSQDVLADGGIGDDVVFGSDGNSTLNGGPGNDSIFAGNGDDPALFGGDGNDSILGAGGIDQLDGGNGNDALDGGAGPDGLLGGSGIDFLNGGEGSDTLDGDAGNDVLNGGNGPDLFVFASVGGGIDRIDDAAPGDVIVVDAAFFVGNVTAGNGSSVGLNQVQISFEGDAATTLFIGTNASPGADVVIQFNDVFRANSFLLNGSEIDVVQVPSVSIADASIAEGDGGQQNLVFTVSLSAATFVDVSVTATTSNGTAIAGPDYGATTAQVTVPAGDTSATVSVPVFGDTADEDNETFTVTLSNPIAATIGDGTAIGTIFDDDAAPPPPPTVSIAGASVGEGDAGSINLVFSVTLSAATTQDVVVTATTANGTASAGSDYTATSAQVTIPAGQTGASVVVPILGDTVGEPDETFTVTLSSPVNATLGAPFIAAGGILDDDGAAGPPVLSIADASLVEGDSGLANMVFTISLSAPVAQAVTANAATSNGTASSGVDYGQNSAAILIPAGQLSTTFQVSILGDNLAEANEAFTLTLSNVAGGAMFPGNAATLGAMGTILDDDGPAAAPLLSIGAASVAEGNGGTGSLIFPLTLSAAAGSAVVASFRTIDGMARPGQDYAGIAAGSVTIPAGQTSGSIAIAVSGDAALECDETLAVELTSVTGGASIAPAASFAFGTIANDDGGTAPSVTGASSSGTEAGEGLAGGAGNDSLSGLGGNDTLSGVAGADILAGGGGNDLMFGDLPGSGNDSILGGDGADTGVGGDGADTMQGGAGDDFLIGEGGADTLMGGLNNDVLFGLDGADYQCGEEGNDFLFGGGGDLMDAGADNDRVHVNAGDIFATGSDGFFDVLVLLDNAPIANTPNQGVTAVDLNATLNQNLSAGGPRLQGFEAVDASIASAGVSVTGAAGTVDFGQGPVTVGAVLFGSTFADTLAGSGAADILLGNTGADVLAGGAGSDTLIADAGNDTLTGGAGADELFYTGAAGAAVIVTDFVPGEDLMDLAASLGIADGLQARLLLQQGGDDVVLPLGGGRSVTFLDHVVADFSADDFQIV